MVQIHVIMNTAVCMTEPDIILCPSRVLRLGDRAENRKE